jgi:hypothetical protein
VRTILASLSSRRFSIFRRRASMVCSRAILVAMSCCAVRISVSWSANIEDLSLCYEASASLIMVWSS